MRIFPDSRLEQIGWPVARTFFDSSIIPWPPSKFENVYTFEVMTRVFKCELNEVELGTSVFLYEELPDGQKIPLQQDAPKDLFTDFMFFVRLELFTKAVKPVLFSLDEHSKFHKTFIYGILAERFTAGGCRSIFMKDENELCFAKEAPLGFKHSDEFKIGTEYEDEIWGFRKGIFQSRHSVNDNRAD